MKKLLTLLFIIFSLNAFAAPLSIPDRQRGEGPFERLVLRGVIIVNGEGAPPVGPMDVLIEGNRITQIRNLGLYKPVPEADRIPVLEGDRVMELEGHYLLPGFVDLHAHFGGDAQGVPAEYVAKLWLGHGITTIREPGSFNGLDWVLEHQARSAKNEIAAPRIFPYVGFGQGEKGPFLTEERPGTGSEKLRSKVPPESSSLVRLPISCKPRWMRQVSKAWAQPCTTRNWMS